MNRVDVFNEDCQDANAQVQRQFVAGKLKVESKGRRWKQMVDSRELARWLGVGHLIVSGDIEYLSLVRSRRWVACNCWFIRSEEVLDYPSRTFTVEKVFWVSQSVAADICRRYRKDFLPELADSFVRGFVQQQLYLAGTFGFVEVIANRIRQFERGFPWVREVLAARDPRMEVLA